MSSRVFSWSHSCVAISNATASGYGTAAQASNVFRSAPLISLSRVDDLLAISLRSRATVIGPAAPIFFAVRAPSWRARRPRKALARLRHCYPLPLLEREIANYLLEPFWRGLPRIWPRWQARDRGRQFHRRLSIGDDFSPRAKGLVEHGTPSSPPRGSWRRASTPTVKGCNGWPAGPAPEPRFTANSAAFRASGRQELLRR
jgi:hypothetical protein